MAGHLRTHIEHYAHREVKKSYTPPRDAVGGLCGKQWNAKCWEPHNNCCSKWGFCSYSAEHCGDGCQKMFDWCYSWQKHGRDEEGNLDNTEARYPPAPVPEQVDEGQDEIGDRPARYPPAVPPKQRSNLLTRSALGSCGPTGLTPSCNQATADKCCSRWNYCGSTPDYCGAGCQPQYVTCISKKRDELEMEPLAMYPPAVPPQQRSNSLGRAAPGTCGATFQSPRCDPATSDICCSKWNYCGSGPNYCGPGCQLQYGYCTSKKRDPLLEQEIRTSYPPAIPPQQRSDSISRDGLGSCGPNGILKVCNQATADKCCSKWNYCGSTPDYCGVGCQPQFGICTSKKLVRGESGVNETHEHPPAPVPHGRESRSELGPVQLAQIIWQGFLGSFLCFWVLGCWREY